MEAADPTAQVGEVEVEVLTLLALEQPVARDLRVLLTARDVAQLGELCLGLCFTLARRANRVQQVLSDDLRAMILEVGEGSGLAAEPGQRRLVGDRPGRSGGGDRLGRRISACPGEGWFAYPGQPEATVPSQRPSTSGRWCAGTSGSTDHAMDIASRVLFAANGTPSSHAMRQAQDSLVSCTSVDPEPPGQPSRGTTPVASEDLDRLTDRRTITYRDDLCAGRGWLATSSDSDDQAGSRMTTGICRSVLAS